MLLIIYPWSTILNLDSSERVYHHIMQRASGGIVDSRPSSLKASTHLWLVRQGDDSGSATYSGEKSTKDCRGPSALLGAHLASKSTGENSGDVRGASPGALIASSRKPASFCAFLEGAANTSYSDTEGADSNLLSNL